MPSAAPVMVGSHLDTQPMGGRFDGVLGVLAALEILRTLQDAGVATEHPIELVNWTNEEGARFAPAMIGSAVFAGLRDLAFALDGRDGAGLRFGDELSRIGFAGDAPIGHALAAYFELHIEQGPILEDEGLEIGVVTHAQGVRWLDVTVTGAAGHAGTTPMDRRHDALVAAAAMVEAVAEVGRRNAPGVATVGQIRALPGSRNVIPGSVVFSVDLRHPVAETLAAMTERVVSGAEGHCRTRAGVDVRIEDLLSFAPTAFDESCVAAVRHAAEICGYGHRDIVSGGGHDACNIARIAPAAMVFCPCVGGVSHTEAEAITPEWAEAGANVLLQAVLAKAG